MAVPVELKAAPCKGWRSADLSDIVLSACCFATAITFDWTLQFQAFAKVNELVYIMQEAARAFCHENGLPEAVVGPLSRHIEDNLAQDPQVRALATGSALASPISTYLWTLIIMPDSQS